MYLTTPFFSVCLFHCRVTQSAFRKFVAAVYRSCPDNQKIEIPFQRQIHRVKKNVTDVAQEQSLQTEYEILHHFSGMQKNIVLIMLIEGAQLLAYSSSQWIGG